MDIEITLTKAGGIDGFAAAPRERHLPAPGELLIRHEAIGVNFIDIYFRRGLYPLPHLPAVLGVEGAGVVEAVGAGVGSFSIGDRVAYVGGPIGAYASTRVLPQEKAVPLPAGVSTRTAAASMLKGITAHMLLSRVHPVQEGSVVFIHAAAGGLGSFLTRWAKHLGAVVVGAVGNEEKAQLARANGADHIVVGRDADFVRAVFDVTGGRGADLAIDGIGGDTLSRTLSCVRPFGTAASIGQAAGPIPPVCIEELGPRRSISLARPSVMSYVGHETFYRPAAAAVLSLLQEGVLNPTVKEYPLRDAAQAQVDLEAGMSFGSLVLIP